MFLKTQLVRFLLVGTATVIVDFSVYLLFLLITEIGAFWSKLFGFYAGVLFSFVCNSKFTFGVDRLKISTLGRFLSVYVLSGMLNEHINSASLVAFGSGIFIPFLLATGTTMIVNFIGMKWFVFRYQ